MGKDHRLDADREGEKQSYETELSFSRWSREDVVDLAGGDSPELRQQSFRPENGRRLKNELPVSSHQNQASFDENKENLASISDEEFEQEFGFSVEQSLLNEEHQSNGYSHDMQQFDEETQKAPTSVKRISVFRSLSWTLFYILIWYTFSTGLTLYNKLLLGADLGQFPAPLLMNTIHFTMQAIVSNLVLRLFCPLSLPVRMSWKDYFSRVLPTAIATALDIDLSNASFIFISVTFATMCKSATPVFLLIFAFIFKLESPSFKLLGIIAVISVGVLLAASKETHFNVGGFILVMFAAVMSGFRWAVMQILLQKEEYGLKNPFAAMSYLTPIMAVVTGVFSLATEPWHKLRQTHYFDTAHHIFESSLLMLLGGSLAFFMVLAEYLLISETSALTLMVAGIVKEVFTIVAAVIFFHDRFTVLKGVGLVIIIAGVSLFNYYKYRRMLEGRMNNQNVIRRNADHEGPVKYKILTDEVGLLG